MSLESVKSPKHCAQRQQSNAKTRFKKLILTASAFVFTISFLIFLLWLTLHPNNPQFTLKQADVYQLNLLDLQFLNSTIQITLSTKNPNQKWGIYYETLQIYAVYKGQQITPATSILGFYQGSEEINFLTAVLAGSGVAVVPSFGFEMGRDRSSGRVGISVRVMGRLRWKLGSWVSGRYWFDVDCVAVMPFGPSIPTVPLSLMQPSRCSITV